MVSLFIVQYCHETKEYYTKHFIDKNPIEYSNLIKPLLQIYGNRYSGIAMVFGKYN